MENNIKTICSEKNITHLWNLSLKKGAINFDPRIKTNFQTVSIGKYIKRIIPDRCLNKSEELLDWNTPVKLSFKIKINNFDYHKINNFQKLSILSTKNGNYNLIASNSPLTLSPHCLLVPCQNRSQFILKKDIETCFEIFKYNSAITFLFSSLGGGAGVNHMHIHLIPKLNDFPMNNSSKKIVFNTDLLKIKKIINWETDTIIFEGQNLVLIKYICPIIKALQSYNIPHNILIRNNQIWLNPRARRGSKTFPNKKFGTWETTLGICNCCSIEEYDRMTYGKFTSALSEIRLNKSEKKIFNNILNNYLYKRLKK